ncbi:hypothetical protein Airi02_050500 [Actinoallomurus iriomotensis]|uniref:Leucine-binding protein domain-containing protein n=1 Tax=Actinoallomurus iriomotensis TaxID=478107 RepID=A0A9W6S4M0_9ACTN|nr:hypothetical protein Airi02_050500 [Actinoallomurus iriomotensis]
MRIGALVPLTPPGWVEAGRHLLAGLETAAHDVNDAGGIAGRPLELMVRDTAADPRKAVAAVDELARLGVAAVAGEYHSVVARAAAARAGRPRPAFPLLFSGHRRAHRTADALIGIRRNPVASGSFTPPAERASMPERSAT